MVNVLRSVAGAVCCFALLPALSSLAVPAVPQPTISHHLLSVEVLPDSHELIVTDRLTVHIPDGLDTVTFSLAPSLRIERISAGGSEESFGGSPVMPFQRATPEAHLVTVRLPDRRPVWTMEWRYRGPINDAPREPRHLRFVTPSDTSGYIGPEGVYLSSESQWYPDLSGSLASYELRIKLPDGWTSVSQGSDPTGSGMWSVTVPSEALTLVANRFAVKTRDWRASNGQTIRLATYLFSEDAHLADEYLDASARYLDAYIPVLGPYPFPKFAVVENFFSSGLGMPSFTLLGAAVIKRHYTQPYALGHEIVHSWIGNGVYNRVNRGNWVEGLTTYLANYYYHELTGDQVRAREQRRLMLFGYAVYVKPAVDYPVAGFIQKMDEKDNAIGYQKAAMVFHMLRREIGDAAFWAGLKELIDKYMGRYADWSDIERMFGTRHGKDLRWFFAQWVEQSGAPRVTVADARGRAEHGSGPAKFSVSATLLQQGTVFRIPVDLRFEPQSQKDGVVRIEMREARQSFTLPVSGPIHDLVLDPDFHVFRRLERRELPPMLNLFVTDAARTVVLTNGESEKQKPFAAVIQRVKSQEAGKANNDRTNIVETPRPDAVNESGSVLFLGYGDDESKATVRESCGERFVATPGGFSLGDATYEGTGFAVLVSCPRRGVPGSVVSLLYGVTPESVSNVARLLFFYGWNSYVVFKDGAVIAKGDWETDMKSEVIVE
jgi:hypothetical protein